MTDIAATQLRSPKLRYLLNSTKNTLRGRGFNCPSCGSPHSRLICRKRVVTCLRRCADCSLLFRAPTISEAESNAFYQADYESGFTTELPGPDALETYLASEFRNSPKDFGRYVRLLEVLGAKAGTRLLDFGCSWGYGAWQFEKHGFDVMGFEVSLSRVRYAREKLGVTATHDLAEVVGPFDIIFFAHVLEHVPSPWNVIAFAFTQLRDGGLFVSITPNGSIHRRLKDKQSWTRAWGLKHPNLLDEMFYQENLKHRPLLLTSALTDQQALTLWTEQLGRQTGPLDGGELLAVCKNQRLN